MNQINPLDIFARAPVIAAAGGKYTLHDVLTVQLNIDQVEALQKNRRPVSHRSPGVPAGVVALYIDTFGSNLIGYGFNDALVLCRPFSIPNRFRFVVDLWFVQTYVRLDAPSSALLEEFRAWVLSVLRQVPEVPRPTVLREPRTELEYALRKFTRPLQIKVPSELLCPELSTDELDLATLQEDYAVVGKHDKTRYESLLDYLASLRAKWGQEPQEPKSLTVTEALSMVLVRSAGIDGCYDEEKSLAVASESAGLNDLQHLQKVALFGHLPPVSLALQCGTVPVLLAENHLFTVGDKTNLTAVQALNAVWGTDHETARWALYHFTMADGQSLGTLLYGLV